MRDLIKDVMLKPNLDLALVFGPYLFKVKSLACRNKCFVAENEYLVVILFKAPDFMMVLGHDCWTSEG